MWSGVGSVTTVGTYSTAVSSTAKHPTSPHTTHSFRKTKIHQFVASVFKRVLLTLALYLQPTWNSKIFRARSSEIGWVRIYKGRNIMAGECQFFSFSILIFVKKWIVALLLIQIFSFFVDKTYHASVGIIQDTSGKIFENISHVPSCRVFVMVHRSRDTHLASQSFLRTWDQKDENLCPLGRILFLPTLFHLTLPAPTVILQITDNRW